SDYNTFFKTYWEGRVGKERFNKALQDGVLESGQSALSTAARTLPDTIGIATVTPAQTPTQNMGVGTFNTGSTSAAASGLATQKPGGKYEIALYQTVAVNNTASGANPWLQELPDPVTKATWDNYA